LARLNLLGSHNSRIALTFLLLIISVAVLVQPFLAQGVWASHSNTGEKSDDTTGDHSHTNRSHTKSDSKTHINRDTDCDDEDEDECASHTKATVQASIQSRDKETITSSTTSSSTSLSSIFQIEQKSSLSSVRTVRSVNSTSTSLLTTAITTPLATGGISLPQIVTYSALAVVLLLVLLLLLMTRRRRQSQGKKQ
jgi:hypothetical protein